MGCKQQQARAWQHAHSAESFFFPGDALVCRGPSGCSESRSAARALALMSSMCAWWFRMAETSACATSSKYLQGFYSSV